MSASPHLSDAEQSSSDIALRHRAPYCVANRWRLTAAYVEEPGERLKRRFAFLETALRYLVAVLASEHTARGLAEVSSWSTLVDSLGGRRITLGLWRDAARDLSVRVLAAPDGLVEPVAGVLAARAERRRTRPAPLCEALDQLVRLRNEDAHPDCVATANAATMLQQTEAPFRAFLSAFRAVGQRPPWVVTDLHYDHDRYEVDAVCLRGIDLLPARRLSVAAMLPRNRPFVVAPDGRVLFLGPLLAWGSFPHRSGGHRSSELRLFSQWDDGPRYSDPVGMDAPVPLTDAPVGAGAAPRRRPADWIREDARVVEGVFAGRPESLRAVLSPEGTEPPPEVDGYAVGEPLGRGGNGRVYLARRARDGVAVALKVLPATLTADPAGRARLRREFELMQGLSHANVARVYDHLEETPSGPVMVMELVAGEDLRARVSRRPLSLPEALGVLRGVLAGLAAAHDKQIVHRDVTPENVIIEPSGNVKLIDFGIAFAVDGERITRTIDGLGKVSFASPEQIHRPRDAGPPADVFACGRLLGFLVSGSVDPAEQHAALPGALQAIVRRATAERADERYPDARALARDLEDTRVTGWEGPPVRPGDRLDDYVVSILGPDLAGGLWAVELQDTYGARWVGIVAEHRPSAEQNLRRTLRTLSPATRERFGSPDVRQTKDGVRWCRLAIASFAELAGGLGTATNGPPASGPGAAGFGAAAGSGSGSAVAWNEARSEPVAAGEPEKALGAERSEPGRGEISEAPPARGVPAAPRALLTGYPPMLARGRPRWTPPVPTQTGEDRTDWILVPPGPFGLLAALFVPAWPFLLLRALAVLGTARLPAPLPDEAPPYLPPLTRALVVADPAQVAHALDTLALIVAVQRLVRGADPANAAGLRALHDDPLRLAWTVLTLPPTGHLAEHRSGLAGAARAHQFAIQGVRQVHGALQRGAASIPPRSQRRVNAALGLLHRLAHAGAKGIPAGHVEEWLVRVLSEAA